MAQTTVRLHTTPNQPAQQLALLNLADQMNNDRIFAHGCWAAAMGVNEGQHRDDTERGLIQLIDMLARRLGDRCSQLDKIRSAEGVS